MTTLPTPPNNTLAIRLLAEEDRPREKLLLKGHQALTNAELLAILIGSGSRNESAVALAQRILASANNNLHELGKKDLASLCHFKGVGQVKAISIIAALELCRRHRLSTPTQRVGITSSKDAYELMSPILADLPHEEFWILLLSQSNQVIGQYQISAGGVAGTVVDARLVFKRALDHLASGIILLHNHPSGSLTPSQADIDLTKKLKQAGTTLNINILDHLIISERGYYSFADEGRI
jgi:DNA repair protein RadC